MMKRITAFLLAAVLLLTSAGCGAPATTAPSTATTVPQEPTQSTTQQIEPPPTTTLPLPPVTVNVTLDPNGGQCDIASLEFQEGEMYGQLPTPVKDGFVFIGWFTAAEEGTQITEETVVNVDADHTLYAHWEIKTRFTVTFDPNGGRISPYYSQIERKNGETYGELPEPLREGYKFLGWYTAPEKGIRVKTTTKFTGDQDTVLYAQWEYDPLLYWRHILDSRVQQIPQCRRVVVYIERTAAYRTYLTSSFLTDAGAINPAEGLEDNKVTDEWIKSVQPYIIVKMTGDLSMSLVSKTGMVRRLPDEEIYVFSTSAINGQEKYQLFYRLYLAKLLYPEYFEDVDIDTLRSELKVKSTVYY